MQKALLFLFLSIFSIEASAQQWLWGKRGGGVASAANVSDMTLDKWGNLYVISSVGGTGSSFDVDGNPVTFYAYPDNYDLLVTSFSCDGSYRWSKAIDGGKSGDSWTIGVDKLGGVYVSGNVNGRFDPATPAIMYIGADTEPSDSSQSIIVVKLDTAGNYEWLRKPQPLLPATFAYASSRVMDMDVDSAGNVRMICRLPSGTYGGSYIAGDSGVHQLQYDANGNFMSGFRFDIDAIDNLFPIFKLRRDHDIDRYYLTCGVGFNTYELHIGGNLVESNMFICAFNNQGQHLWTKKGTKFDQYPYGLDSRASIDDSGFVYVAGATTSNDTFAGYVVVNSVSPIPIAALPFVAKLDSTGSLQWAVNASCQGVGARGLAAAVSGSDELVLGGIYNSNMMWPGYNGPLPGMPGQPDNYNVFLTTFNRHTGAVLAVDTLGSSSPSWDWVAALTADQDGQIYLGGPYENDLHLGTVDTLSPGGIDVYDMYVVKYGISICSTTTVKDIGANGQLNMQVYPNPAGDVLNIHTLEATPYYLYGVMGNLIQQGELRKGHNVINVSSLASGVYFLRAGNNGKMIKVVKE